MFRQLKGGDSHTVPRRITGRLPAHLVASGCNGSRLTCSVERMVVQSKSRMAQAPGPRGSPQLLHGLADGVGADPLAATANTESWGASFLLWHLGHSALSRPNTRASNSCSQSWQMYSKIGMVPSPSMRRCRLAPRSSDSRGRAALQRRVCHDPTSYGLQPRWLTGPKGRFLDGTRDAALKGRSSTAVPGLLVCTRQDARLSATVNSPAQVSILPSI